MFASNLVYYIFFLLVFYTCRLLLVGCRVLVSIVGHTCRWQLLVVGCRLSVVGCQMLTALVLSCCRCLVLVPGCREWVVVWYWLLIVCVGCRIVFFSLSVPISAYTQSNLAPISHTYTVIPPPPPHPQVHTAHCTLPQTGT